MAASNTAIAATVYGHALVFEERPVAMRTIGDALVAIGVFARHFHLAPMGTWRQNDGATTHHSAAFKLNLMQPARLCGGNERRGTLAGRKYTAEIGISRQWTNENIHS